MFLKFNDATSTYLISILSSFRSIFCNYESIMSIELRKDKKDILHIDFLNKKKHDFTVEKLIS